MGWNGNLTEDSPVGSSITLSPDSTDIATYTVYAFTAAKKGIYQFTLNGSGGRGSNKDGSYGERTGGEGGHTVGYLLLEQGQTVYVGVGGTCSAAFVAAENGDKLSSIGQESLYFVAGAGGEGANYNDKKNKTGFNCVASSGADGGGLEGGSSDQTGGGTQIQGGVSTASTNGGKSGSYGTGGTGNYDYKSDYSCNGGRGGDGYYGGAGGFGDAHDNGIQASGGAGGSGFVRTETLVVGGTTYTSITTQGGGALPNSVGSVMVTYYARGELPIVYNGVRIEKLVFNGTEINSLVYNGIKLF